jgi:hypothetical protein
MTLGNPVFAEDAIHIPQEFGVPYVRQDGVPQTASYAPYYRYTDNAFTNPAGILYSSAELEAWMLLYLAQTFATMFCQDQNVTVPPPVFASGGGSIPLNYATSIGAPQGGF